MRIGLIDIDSHARVKKWGATVYPNLALCKISAYHKSVGDLVEWYNPIHEGRFDRVYMSKIFNFSLDYPYYVDADEVVKGGTGYDVTSRLRAEVEEMQPDYSIYPTVPVDVSYGFLTRGCPNKCKWCVVPRKEGAVAPYWDIERVANGKRKVVLMDNNILAAGEYGMEQLRKIVDLGLRVDFNQALDARLVNDENVKLLGRIKWLNSIVRFGCDTKGQIAECERAMTMMNAEGYNGFYFLYTMLSDSIDESYERINYWKEQLKLSRAHRGGV